MPVEWQTTILNTVSQEGNLGKYEIIFRRDNFVNGKGYRLLFSLAIPDDGVSSDGHVSIVETPTPVVEDNSYRTLAGSIFTGVKVYWGKDAKKIYGFEIVGAAKNCTNMPNESSEITFTLYPDDVHVVTQLITSMLGLIVLPVAKQKFNKVFLQRPLTDLINEGCEWKIIFDKDTEDPTNNLRRLVEHLRNAIAHGKFEFCDDEPFNSDARSLGEIKLIVEDYWKNNSPKPYWRAEILGQPLRQFCFLVAEAIGEK